MWRGLEQAPEVQTVLERHLDPSHDPAFAVRAVYGRYIFALDYLDRAWTSAHVPRVFPHDEGCKNYWNAAWDSFIRFAQPNADLFHRLEGEYRYAIAQLGARADEDDHGSRSVESLAEELMLFYWHGELDLQDPNGLLSFFYEKAPSSLRAHALESVGRMLQNSENDVPEEVIQRLKCLWASRLKDSIEKQMKHPSTKTNWPRSVGGLPRAGSKTVGRLIDSGNRLNLVEVLMTFLPSSSVLQRSLHTCPTK